MRRRANDTPPRADATTMPGGNAACRTIDTEPLCVQISILGPAGRTTNQEHASVGVAVPLKPCPDREISEAKHRDALTS